MEIDFPGPRGASSCRRHRGSPLDMARPMRRSI